MTCGRSRSRAWAWTAVLGIEALAVLALLIFGAPDPKLAIIRWGQLAILTVAGLAGWIATVVRARTLPPVVPGALLLVVLGALPATVLSPYPSLAWPAVWLQLMAAGTALLIWQQAASVAGRRDLLALIAMLLGAIVGVYLVTVAREWAEWLTLGMPASALPLRPGNLGGLLPIPTWLADAVVAIGPVGVAALWRMGTRGRLVGASIGIASLIAILLSGTRSIWLLLPLGAAVFVLGTRPAYVKRAVVVGGLAAAIAGGALAVTGLGAQILRDIDEGRSSAFTSALRLFAERPLVGGGPGTYGVFRLGHDVEQLEWLAFPSAHNIVLNTFAETGIVGFSASAAALVLLARRWRRSRSRDSDTTIRIAALSGLAMLTGHALVDVVFEQPGLLVLGIVAAGLALVEPRSAERGADSHAVRPRHVGRAIGAAALVIAVLGGVPSVRVELAIAELAAADPIDLPSRDALSHARRATDLAPDLAPAWTAVAARAAAAGDDKTALAAARRSIDLDQLAQHPVAVAWLLVDVRDEGAGSAIGRIDPESDDPFVLLNSALLLAEIDAPDAAIESVLARLVETRPDLGAVADAFPDRIRPAMARARVTAIDRLLAAGDLEAALVAAVTAHDRESLDRIALAAPGDALVIAARRSAVEGAIGRATLDSVVRDGPRRPRAMWLAWYLAASQCDAAEAVRWERVHRTQFGATPVAPVEAGRVPNVTVAQRPTLYPEAIWKVTLPSRPYVTGTWVIRFGTPSCS